MRAPWKWATGDGADGDEREQAPDLRAPEWPPEVRRRVTDAILTDLDGALNDRPPERPAEWGDME